jgi:ribonuclease VapC
MNHVVRAFVHCAGWAISQKLPTRRSRARITGDLAAQTGALGLSLGERACLAFALALKAPVYTADKSLKKLKVSVRIHFIRG